MTSHPSHKPPVKHSPLFMAFVNLLLLGIPYLFLHLYKRFFIVYALVMASVVATMFTNIPVQAASAFSYILLFAVCVDSYIQAQKINQMPNQPKSDKRLLAIGLPLIIINLGIYFGARATLF